MTNNRIPPKDTVEYLLRRLIRRNENMLVVDTFKALSDRIEEVDREIRKSFRVPTDMLGEPSTFGERTFGRILKNNKNKIDKLTTIETREAAPTEISLVKSSKEWTLQQIVEQLEFVGYRSGTHFLVNSDAFLALKELAEQCNNGK